ncbi:hypothetical protein JXO59_09685, partial [candidate division KSB1 bacterium]|nr:hypothetical protein [candidate division KSB1 bacterium]
AASETINGMMPKSASEPVRIKSIPSEKEVAALAAIYDLGQPTQVDIYAQLNSSIHMTAQDLDAVLTELVQKGWLQRQMISPRNELLFITPAGNVGVEKSALNRRNRVYRYTSVIDRNHLMNFLQAQLYLQKRKAPSGADNTLQKLILLLVKP